MSEATILSEVSHVLMETFTKNICFGADPDEIVMGDDRFYTFNSPADIDLNSVTLPLLSIYLFQITENSSLKNLYLEPVQGEFKYQKPPAVVDLYYLFTPYASDRETEWTVLEKISRTFRNQAMITVDKSNPAFTDLIKSGNAKIRVVPGSLTFQEITEMWNCFPNKPFKLSMVYMLTEVKIPSENITEMTKVTEFIVKTHNK